MLQLVAEAAAGPSQDEETRQAAAQEMQTLKDSLSQAEAKLKEQEGQLEKINKVKPFIFTQSISLWHMTKYAFSCLNLTMLVFTRLLPKGGYRP